MDKRTVNSQRYFDAWAPYYDRDVHEYEYAVPRAVFSAVSSHMPMPNIARARMLDLGIGTGLSSSVFKKACAVHITGADVSTRMLGECAKKGVADSLHQCDIARDEFPAGPYDLVVSSGVMEFINNPESVLQRMAKVMKDGALAVISYEPADGAIQYKPRLWTGVVRTTPEQVIVRRAVMFGWKMRFTYKYLHLPEAITRFCADAGLAIVSESRFMAYRYGPETAFNYNLLTLRK